MVPEEPPVPFPGNEKRCRPSTTSMDLDELERIAKSGESDDVKDYVKAALDRRVADIKKRQRRISEWEMEQRAQYGQTEVSVEQALTLSHGEETKKLDDEKTMTNDEKTNDAAAASHRDELMTHA